MSDVPKGLADMFAAALRGGTKATLGLPGDLEGLGRLGINWMHGSEAVKPESALWNTEDMDRMLPPMTPLTGGSGRGKEQHPYESVGQFLPINAVGPVISGAKAVGRGASEVANALRISDIAPDLGRRGALGTLGKAGAVALAPMAAIKALREVAPEAKLLGSEAGAVKEGVAEVAGKIAGRFTPAQLSVGRSLESAANTLGYELPPHFDDVLKEARRLYPGMSDDALATGINNLSKMHEEDLAYHLFSGEHGSAEYKGLGWSDLEKQGIRTTEDLYKGVFKGKVDPSKLRLDILGDLSKRPPEFGFKVPPHEELFTNMQGNIEAEYMFQKYKTPQEVEKYLKDLEDISKHNGTPNPVGNDVRKRATQFFKDQEMLLESQKRYKSLGDDIEFRHAPRAKISIAPVSADTSTPLAAGFLASALRKDLIMAHNVRPRSLQVENGGLPSELYNPSFGIGKDKVPAFGGETAILIPRPEKFDPKTSNTVLTALDSFSPRYRDAAGERVDALRSQIRPDVAPNFQTSWNADLAKGRAANDRLWDRFISINPMGGIGGEGMSGKVVPGIMELPKYGSGANPKLIAEALRRQTEALNRIDPLHRMSIGPRHQSYEAFNESPYGANRINSTSPKNRPMESVYEDLNKFIDAHFSAEHDFTPRQKYKALVDAAGAKGEAPEVRAEAQSIIRDLRTMHSAYGELKAFGPVGLNKENFAGIILPPTTSDADYKVATALRESAKERGLRVTNEPDLSSGFMDQQEKEGQMAEMVRWLLKAPRK